MLSFLLARSIVSITLQIGNNLKAMELAKSENQSLDPWDPDKYGHGARVSEQTS